jgi:hypothetical protein
MRPLSAPAPAPAAGWPAGLRKGVTCACCCVRSSVKESIKGLLAVLAHHGCEQGSAASVLERVFKTVTTQALPMQARNDVFAIVSYFVKNHPCVAHAHAQLNDRTVPARAARSW